MTSGLIVILDPFYWGGKKGCAAAASAWFCFFLLEVRQVSHTAPRSRRGQRRDAEWKENRSNRTINPVVLVRVEESILSLWVQVQKGWKCEEMFACKRGKKIVDVNINCYFENNPSVAETECAEWRLRQLPPQWVHCWTSVHFAFFAAISWLRRMTSSYLKLLHFSLNLSGRGEEGVPSPKCTVSKWKSRHRPIRSRFLAPENCGVLWREDKLLISSSDSKEHKKKQFE